MRSPQLSAPRRNETALGVDPVLLLWSTASILLGFFVVFALDATGFIAIYLERRQAEKQNHPLK